MWGLKTFLIILSVFFISCSDSGSTDEGDQDILNDFDAIVDKELGDNLSDDSETQKGDASGADRDFENDELSDEIPDDVVDEVADDSDVALNDEVDEELDENTDVDTEVHDETTDNETPDEDSSSALFTGIRIIGKGGFFQPDQLFTDGSTRLAVVENSAKTGTRIFDLSGTPVCEIDDVARGVTFDDEGNIYITIFGNEVKKYSSTCTYITKAGSTGTGDGQFGGMFGIAFYNNKLYIADKNNGRIQLFNKDLTFDSVLGIGALDKPVEIDINTNGQIAVYEDSFSSRQIRVFKNDLSEDWTTTDVSSMAGMALRDNGTVVITYSGQNCARLYKNGSRVDTVGACGDSDGVLEEEFDIAAGVTSLDDGSVLIADKGNSRIKKFTEATVDNLDLSDIIYGIDYRFTRSESLWIDSSDHLYFTDYGMVRVIDETGTKIRDIASPGEDENELNDPFMMTVDSNNVYVVDTNNNYLYSFNKSGVFQNKVAFTDNIVVGMANDSSFVYVATNNDLFRFDKSDITTSESVTLSGLSGKVTKITNGNNGVLFVHDGTSICRFANADSTPNCIAAAKPNVMTEDNDGNLLAIYDIMLKKYDSNLNELGTLTRDDMGAEWGFLEYTKGLAVDSNDYVYIAESTSARSQIIVIDLHF